MKNIYILPTDKPSRLTRALHYNNSLRLVHKNYKCDVKDEQYQNMYITSDVEIKDGDVVKIPCGVGKVKKLNWKFGNDNPSYIVEDIFINKLRYGQKEGELQINSFRYEDVKKIILTTDQYLIKDGVQEIDDGFLEWFVKNPSCEFINIEELYFHGSGYYKASELSEQEKEKYSFMKTYKIIIPKEEPKTKCYCGHTIYCDCPSLEEDKQTTLEEAAERIFDGFGDITKPIVIKRAIELVKCQQERMYSEEDLHNAFYNGWTYRGDNYTFPKAKKEWIENLKRNKWKK